MCDRKNPSLYVCTLRIGIFAFKMTTEIICLQYEVPIVLITTLDLETFIKRHHVYKDIWTPKQGEQLDVLMEPDNQMDKFAVCVKINEKIVGHLKKGTPERFAKTIFYFLRSDAYSSAWAKFTGKRCNLGVGEGMQVPCKLNLFEQPKFVSLLRKELMKMKEIQVVIFT